MVEVREEWIDQLLSHENKTGNDFLGQRKFYKEEQLGQYSSG